MQFDPAHIEYHRLCHLQEKIGEQDRHSEKLSEYFICSKEQRDILARVADHHGQGKVLFLLNYCYSPAHLWDKSLDIYDTYIFFQYREPVFWHWWDEFMQNHPNQKVVLITMASFLDPTDPRNKNYPNFHLIEYQHWNYRVSRSLVNYHRNYTFEWPRPCRISSLCNKPNFFKSLTTAFLHKNYSHRPDVLMSWNVNQRGGPKYPSTASLYQTYNRELLDELCEYYRTTLSELSIKQDKFWIDQHYENNDWQNTKVYQNSLVNITNETYGPGMQDDCVFPGPFFSEKTRKPLFAGCAVIPMGQTGSYVKLEQLGFKFEYPWNKDFDLVEGDLDRTEKVLDVVKQVMDYDMDWLQAQLRDSVEYNYYYIRSREFLDHINHYNEQSLARYLSNS